MLSSEQGKLNVRRLLRWKTLFYDFALPLVRRLGPRCADRLIEASGYLLLELPPWRRKFIESAVSETAAALGASWPVARTAKELARGIPRFLARDYPLDCLSDGEALDRFDVTGFDAIEKLLAQGEGLILVGGHFGAHLAAIHWLFRRGVNPKLFVQRPTHVSRYLSRRLDLCSRQRRFFVRRKLSAAEATEKVLLARDEIKSGGVVYLAGDIPWPGVNSRSARFLGKELSFQSVWADLAALARAPAASVFCSHLPGGRFELSFDAPRRLERGEESAAVEDYLQSLEGRILARPAEAVCHILWDCYRCSEPTPPPALTSAISPSRVRRRRPLSSADRHTAAAEPVRPSL